MDTPMCRCQPVNTKNDIKSDSNDSTNKSDSNEDKIYGITSDSNGDKIPKIPEDKILEKCDLNGGTKVVINGTSRDIQNIKDIHTPDHMFLENLTVKLSYRGPIERYLSKDKSSDSNENGEPAMYTIMGTLRMTRVDHIVRLVKLKC